MTDFPRNNLWYIPCSVMGDRTAGDTPRIDVSIAFILVSVAARSNKLSSDERLPYNLAYTHLYYS